MKRGLTLFKQSLGLAELFVSAYFNESQSRLPRDVKQIALCRGIGIPARYVAGYAVNLQPPDFHGFMEAFLDGQWYLFDPTRLAMTSGLVRIGVGRDAADVSFATLNGDARLIEKSVWANDTSNQNQSSNNDLQTAAISTA